MYEWNEAIQKVIDSIDDSIQLGLEEELLLNNLAHRIGYSKFHATRYFKKLTGITFREYVNLRRLAFSVIELRDSNENIINIAVKFGFSSHEAYTRAFKNAYNITPKIYRENPTPIKLRTKCNTFDRYLLGIGENNMEDKKIQEIKVYVTTLPAHKFLHIKNYESEGYFDFWALQEAIPGQDCHTICGMLDSIKGKLDGEDNVIGQFSGQIMGHIYESSRRKAEVYGIRLPIDYEGNLPEMMICIDVPEGEYIIFEHDAFNYDNLGDTVVENVTKAAFEYDFSNLDYELQQTDNRLEYIYHCPDKYYKIIRPIKRKENLL